MTSIRWVCISDLHLGALNSLLTNVTADGERVDGSGALPGADRSVRVPPVPAATRAGPARADRARATSSNWP